MVNENAALTIPTSSGEEIVLELTDLPQVSELLDLLTEEHVPLSYWPNVALAYYLLDRRSEFVELLKYAENMKVDPGSLKDQMHCIGMLAAFYVGLGKASRDEAFRKKQFGDAALLFTTADKIMMYDCRHLSGRAYFCLLDCVKWDQAKTQFDYVIRVRSFDIIAILGRALVAYALGEYPDALNYFKKALRFKTDLPPAVRLGLGHCYNKVGNLDKAKGAFSRVIELEETNIPARVALGTLLYHEGTAEGEDLLWEAIQVDQDNPVILLQLANMTFLKGNTSESEDLAWKAYRSSTQNEHKGQSLFLYARCLHAKRDFDKASKFYHQSLTFGLPKFVLPHIGLGRIYLGKGEFSKAIESFEKVLKEAPESVETLKILGTIYTRWQGTSEDGGQASSDQHEKGVQMLEKALELVPDDVEIIMQLAQVLESTKPAEALKKYNEGLKKLPEDEVPEEVYANMACLNIQLGHVNEAQKLTDKAIHLIVGSEDPENLSDESMAKLIVVQFNMAKMYEATGRFDLAVETYEVILKRRPGFVDAVLRLGCIARDQGDTEKALTLFEKATAIDPSNVNGILFAANILLQRGDAKLAQSKFEQVLKSKDHKDDPYALVGLGNVWLEALYNVRSGDKDEKEKLAKYRDSAMNCFVKVLRHHPHNELAANGVACLLAFKGQFTDARDIHSQVREEMPDFIDVQIDMAHVSMDMRQYGAALQMYKTIMKRNHKQFDVQMLQYAARAAWKSGNFVECREFLQRAAIEAPGNLLVRYSLCIVIQCCATQILQEEKASLEQLEGAIEDLKIAERGYLFLAKQPDDVMIKWRYISRTTCSAEARVCKDVLSQAKQYYASASKRAKEEKAKEEAIRAEREAVIRKRKEEEEAARKKIEEEKLRLQMERQRIIEKTQEMLKVIPMTEDREKEREHRHRKKKDKSGDGFVNDDSDMGDWQGAGEGGEGGAKRQKKRKTKRTSEGGGRRRHARETGDESGEDSENRRPRKKKKHSRRDDEREEEVVRKGKIKSREFVSESSSSDNEGPTMPADTEEIVHRPISSDDSDDDDSDNNANAPAAATSDDDDDSSHEQQPVKRARIAADSDDSDADEDSRPAPAARTIASDDDDEADSPPPRAPLSDDDDDDDDSD